MPRIVTVACYVVKDISTVSYTFSTLYSFNGFDIKMVNINFVNTQPYLQLDELMRRSQYRSLSSIGVKPKPKKSAHA